MPCVSASSVSYPCGAAVALRLVARRRGEQIGQPSGLRAVARRRRRRPPWKARTGRARRGCGAGRGCAGGAASEATGGSGAGGAASGTSTGIGAASTGASQRSLALRGLEAANDGLDGTGRWLMTLVAHCCVRDRRSGDRDRLGDVVGRPRIRHQRRELLQRPNLVRDHATHGLGGLARLLRQLQDAAA